MDEAEASRLVIIVEELVTNLYDHGGLNTEAVVMIELSLTATDVGMVLTDSGRPFDPSFARLDRPVPARGGGAGLKLVRAWAIHTDYETAEGFNRLEVRLARQTDQP